MFLKTTNWLPGIEEIPTTRQNWQEDTGDGLSVNIALVTEFSPLPATISMLTACVSMVTAWLLILLLLAGWFLLMMTKKVYSRACALSQRSLSLMPLNFFFHGFFSSVLPPVNQDEYKKSSINYFLVQFWNGFANSKQCRNKGMRLCMYLES